jgi:C-terminal processing protease CtpA/Prc
LVPRQLPNGWSYSLAAETYRTIEGEALEGVGLRPDSPTAPPESAAPADLWERDIAHALTWLNTLER